MGICRSGIFQKDPMAWQDKLPWSRMTPLQAEKRQYEFILHLSRRILSEGGSIRVDSQAPWLKSYGFNAVRPTAGTSNRYLLSWRMRRIGSSARLRTRSAVVMSSGVETSLNIPEIPRLRSE